MSIDLQAGVVRILNAKELAVGTGFVVSPEGFIATCMHVVEDARTLQRDSDEFVNVSFLKVKGEQVYSAKLLTDYTRESKGKDVAILKLDGSVPEEVVPLPLGSSADAPGKDFITFGFPLNKREMGMWGNCVMSYFVEQEPDEEAISKEAVRLIQIKSTEVAKGFSGAPIWDKERQVVIGMVTSIIGRQKIKINDKVLSVDSDPDGKQQDTAFATPVETLQEVCPQLQVSDECPYIRLEPFNEQSRFFFGRENMVKAIITKLKKELRFLAVLGPSGSGKSSVIRAGLLPQLAENKIEDSKMWGIIIIRPAEDPFKYLADEGLETRTQDLTTSVKVWFSQHPEQTRLVFFIDQFEELLTTTPEGLRKRFIQELTNLLGAPVSITVIIAMRDDFYLQFLRQAMLVDWLQLNQINIPKTLNEAELRAIIADPASRVGLRFEDGLVNAIIDDAIKLHAKASIQDEIEKLKNISTEPVTSIDEERVADSTILPLLESALTQLWEKRDRDNRILTRRAYVEDVNGIKGSLTRWADNCYFALDKGERNKARRIFTDLVYIGDKEQGIPDSRRRLPFTALCRQKEEVDEIRRVVSKLATGRLLVTEQGMVDIIHDALISEWSRLKQWLQEGYKFLIWRQEFIQRVRAWVKTNPDDLTKRGEYKLDEGPDLDEAMWWHDNSSFEMSQDELDFIAASQKKQDQEKQLHKVLEQQQLQAEVELRNRQRFKRRAFISGAVAVVVSAAGLMWLDQTDNWYWFTPKGTTLFVYRGHIQAGIVFGVAWSTDGKRIASGSSDLRVDICNALDGGNVEEYKGHSKTVVGVAWSHDGMMIASASDDQTIQVWNTKTIKTIHIYTGHTDAVHSVQWSPNGRYLASGSNDHTARVWDTTTQTNIYTYRGHKSFVWNVAWSPDGTQIVSASSDNTVHIWDAFTGNTRIIYQGHTNEVFGVGWSPDGKYIASGGRDTTVQVWSAETGVTVYTFRGHADNIDTVAWSPDGKRIASAGGHDNKSISNRDDHIVRVWDALDGGNLLIYTGHTNRVHCVAWSPDGTKIVSGGYDLTAQVWKAM